MSLYQEEPAVPDLTPASQSALQKAEPKWPVDSLEFILQACDPKEALEPGDSRLVNLDEARHGIGIARFERALRLRAPHGGFHHGLLCGYRGSGKSTELLKLRQWADKNGFLAAWAEVNVQFGMIDLDYSDIFLLAATMAEKAMQEFGHGLPEAKIRSVISWFRDVIKEDTAETKSEISVEVGGPMGADNRQKQVRQTDARYVAQFACRARKSRPVCAVKRHRLSH